MRKTQYEKGYEAGRNDEAEITLENLLALQMELNSVGYDSENSHINTLIDDLSKALGR